MTQTRPTRTALVTGASSGIGLEVARELAVLGYRVLGTSRNPDTIPDDKRLPGVEYVAPDLADRDSIQACADAVGDVDVVVHNAGEPVRAGGNSPTRPSTGSSRPTSSARCSSRSGCCRTCANSTTVA